MGGMGHMMGGLLTFLIIGLFIFLAIRLLSGLFSGRGFSFAGGFSREASRAVRADRSFVLKQIDFRARVFDPLKLICGRHALIDRCQNCMQVAQAAPIAQMLFVITSAQATRIIDGEFERHERNGAWKASVSDR